jgi:hypothetical protein
MLGSNMIKPISEMEIYHALHGSLAFHKAKYGYSWHPFFFPPYSWLCHWCRRNSMVDFGMNPILRGTHHLEKHPSCVMPDRAIDRTCLWPVKSVCLNNSYAQLCLGEASDSWGVISFQDLGSDWTSNERFIWWSDTEKNTFKPSITAQTKSFNI